MSTRRIALVFFSILTFLGLAITTAAPAAAQYGSPPPPPPPPGGGGGGYYQRQPNYYPPPPPPGVQRRGFTIGASLGLGSFAQVNENGDEVFRLEGLGFELHLGGMVTPNVAVLFDLWAVGGDTGYYESIFHNIGTIGLRWWPANILWIQGGLGWSNVSYEDTYSGYSEVSETGGALMGAVGVELFQAPNFALDVSLRLGAGAYDGSTINQASLQIGVNWY